MSLSNIIAPMFRRLVPPTEQKHAAHHRQGWYPPALRWWNLVLTVLVCWLFIAVLQFYLYKSQTDGGVIFAPNINGLPLRRSFAFLYMPTIIAVIFSIFIIWIDHDAKRFEPYRQMSKPNGALGKDSLLLQYPFDFIPVVPFVAFKRRHWLVFWASLATVLITFGIVPLQAGIFSIKLITRIFPQTFAVSDMFIHSSMQASALTLGYAQSVYGILELNETLPGFTTRNYTLKPFTIAGHSGNSNGTWTANTTMYSLDLRCEEGQPARRNSVFFVQPIPKTGFNSSTGCFVETEILNWNTRRLHSRYSASFLGYYPISTQGNFWGKQRLGGSLEFHCETEVANRTFFAEFTQNREPEDDLPTNFTAIFCMPLYHEQDVEATVDASTKAPISVIPHGEKRRLSAALFNATVFEETLASGTRQVQTRENSLPVDTLPQCLENLRNTDVTTPQEPILAMTLMASKHRIQELLDPVSLGDAYQLVYRLLFARVMTDVLRTDFSSATSETTGRRLELVEAVVLEPFFTYMVEGLLSLVSVAALVLLSIGRSKYTNRKLTGDPGSMGSVMSMVADEKALLVAFEDLDCSSLRYLQQKVQSARYKLSDQIITGSVSPSETEEPSWRVTDRRESGDLRLAKPVRPREFRMVTGIFFNALFIALVIVLAVLFATSRPHGLPLPSKNRTVQNLVSKYLPTAVATLIEPIWILLNRLLCLLQPLEQMRRSRAPASQSIALNYSSLPPQLTLIEAIRSGHILLATVCGMALLANLLATAFAGLIFRQTVPLSRPTVFSPPFELLFANIDGSSGPRISQVPGTPWSEYSGAYQGGGEDHFMASESNLTRNTSLPSWTDGKAMYLPFMVSRSVTSDVQSTYEARTKYISAEPKCIPLIHNKDYHLRLWNHVKVSDNNTVSRQIFDVQVSDANGDRIICYSAQDNLGDALGPISRIPSMRVCREGKTAAELVTTLEASPNATSHEKAVCMSAVVVGWMRTTQWNCPQQEDPERAPPPGFEDASSNNTLLLTCQPSVHIGSATLTVDSSGLLQGPASDLIAYIDQSPEALEGYFSSGAASLVAQSNLFLFRSLVSPWHNDTIASEFIHYFINRAEGSLRFTDPAEPLPTFEDIIGPINQAYARLFAIWLGVNKELLFLPATNTTKQMNGITITQEERLFFTVPLFIISETILGIYILVSLLIYLRRPGRYLPRMPTSLAAIIALFASSAAVRDLQHTSHMSTKEREKHLHDLDCRYGYGSYVGGDGSVHVGIEKVPYVRAMEETRFEHSRVHREIRRRNGKKQEEEEYVPLGDGDVRDARDADALDDEA